MKVRLFVPVVSSELVIRPPQHPHRVINKLVGVERFDSFGQGRSASHQLAGNPPRAMSRTPASTPTTKTRTVLRRRPVCLLRASFWSLRATLILRSMSCSIRLRSASSFLSIRRRSVSNFVVIRCRSFEARSKSLWVVSSVAEL